MTFDECEGTDMKRILMFSATLLFSLTLVLSLVACGGKGPTVTQQVYDRGQSVVQTTEQYLNGSISAEQARDSVTKDHEAIFFAANTKNEGDNSVLTYTGLIKSELDLVVMGSDNMRPMIEQDLQSLKDALASR